LNRGATLSNSFVKTPSAEMGEELALVEIGSVDVEYLRGPAGNICGLLHARLPRLTGHLKIFLTIMSKPS
jgi:hypothetical protein